MSSELIGAALGPYEIVEFLGMHGIAEVFRGRRVENDRAVLIRLAGRGLPTDPVWSARFRREAKAIAALRHANIAPAYDFGEALDGHYMVTDYPDESTLVDSLVEVRNGARSFQSEDITFLIRQIAAALDHAHARGVVHRDVSPPHISITRSGQAILADFGLAFLLSRGSPERTGGAAFAVPEYLAPEFLADFRAASPASDTYSLGVVLYEMLTGDLPFRPGTDVNAALQSITGAIPDPRLRKPDIFPAVADVVVNAMAESPKDRFKSTMQLAEALELAYRYPNGIPTRQSRPTPERPSTDAPQPPAPVAHRSTAERIVVRRGQSPRDERRQRARLRGELQDIQSEEKRRRRAEQKQIRQQKSRAFWNKWGPGLALLAVFVVIVGGALFGLQALGVLAISVAPPTLPPDNAAGTLNAMTAMRPAPTEPPTPTPILSPTPLQPGEATPIPALVFTPLGVGSTVFRALDGAPMQFVPAGQFMMGSNDLTRAPSVRPRHPVMLSDFWIDRTEVANTQYGLCVAAGVCAPPSNPRYFDDPGYADYPVVFIDYPAAAAYCLWLARQTGQVIGLPTEAQWEKSAAWDPVANASRTYPWGDSPPDPTLMRYQAGVSDRPASPVGSHPAGASAYGALDMAGNVGEWVADWWDPDYYGRTGIAVDPIGPLTGTRRVTRGGSWRDDSVLTMSNVRNPADPAVSGDSLGFRCAMTAGRPPQASGLLLTPLDVTQSLGEIMTAAASDPANGQAAVTSWVSALDELKQSLQAGDHARALASISALRSQLDQMLAANEVTVGLVWRVGHGLAWIEGQFPPEATPTASATPTAGLETPGVTLSAVTAAPTLGTTLATSPNTATVAASTPAAQATLEPATSNP